MKRSAGETRSALMFLQPYTMVKDLRTGEETGNVANVLDGGLGSVHQRLPALAESGLSGPQGIRRRLI